MFSVQIAKPFRANVRYWTVYSINKSDLTVVKGEGLNFSMG